FNHRYHPALLKAQELVAAGALGELMFCRARYGHGGRLGYEKEWRADPALSGGGELIDQGVHLIDLARLLLGEEFTSVQGHAQTCYWDMPVDDNAFLLLRTARGQTASLHASCSEWKNLFSFELYGRTGKLDITGLGGSYGVERLTWYRMLPEMGPPDTQAWEYPRGDRSWALEFADFLDDIRLGREPRPGLRDAQAALTIVARIYELSR
ncbi:MAG: Gfo/Idh/MocA family oxidoreductase, partial [Planctomycetes bacterium]|nr:Gfo/Idh/MocA family oxidoreductase [Planctomycetota bacterium]